MVCDAAMIVSTLVTFAMNGACCVYQMQEDEDLRKCIRKDIRVEYERQRVIDMERWAEQYSRERNHRSESSIDHDRRKRLLHQKVDLFNQASRDGGVQEREGAPGARSWPGLSEQAFMSTGKHDDLIEVSKVASKRSRSVTSSKFAERRLAQKMTAQAASSDMSSLLDSDNDDNTTDDTADDESSLVDVDLH
ncbi:hypothetical protein FisN_3Lh301 [Fistulifera solaris]|uniref:Uncharacterized protein n=1 Tax=Fistulifera solaris TaxID=1519565 RepID=A0A1Z5J809_FISSO|nr:hypothetical protein FisN_3Lh301 [Fistulifera solaris]|eukprot:GAX10110.1 hypothetical protein FisN_3Lh301 [Fistulifera solaris]